MLVRSTCNSASRAFLCMISLISLKSLLFVAGVVGRNKLRENHNALARHLVTDSKWLVFLGSFISSILPVLYLKKKRGRRAI